jgi:hypothetical protein
MISSADRDRVAKLTRLAQRPGTAGEGAAARAALARLFERNPQLRADALIGISIKLERRCDRERPCCECCGRIAEGKGPHRHALLCEKCGSHRGWLSRRAADLLLDLHLAGRLSSLPTLHDASIKP